MYRSKVYRERSIDDIKSDIEKCALQNLQPEKVFLCDGDALGASQELLVRTLECIKEKLPSVKRVGIYATAENMLEKSVEELTALKNLGLKIAYLGLESGDDKILHMIVKGNTAQEMVDASLKIKNAGIKLSTIVMLGVGGRKHSENHIKNTALLLSQTAPHFLSFLTTFAVEGTPYHTMQERGLIEPLTSLELLTEMKGIIAGSDFSLNEVLFRANHVSNAQPLGGLLPRDKEILLSTIDLWMTGTPKGQYPTRPESM